MIPDVLKPAICTNCNGKGVFIGDDGCGCMECPPDKRTNCFVCGGSGLNPAMIRKSTPPFSTVILSAGRYVVIPLEVSE